MEFLLHKEKKEKAHTQKQECGCPSLQPSLSNHTHAFLADPLVEIYKVYGIKAFTTIK